MAHVQRRQQGRPELRVALPLPATRCSAARLPPFITHAVLSVCLPLPLGTARFWYNFSNWGTLSSINYLAGTISYLFALVLWSSSLSWVRRRFFEVSGRAVAVLAAARCSILPPLAAGRAAASKSWAQLQQANARRCCPAW